MHRYEGIHAFVPFCSSACGVMHAGCILWRPSYYFNPFLLFSDDYLILPSGNLQIISVSAQHQGMYKCGAVNPVTKETVIQSHGTKLSVKCKLDDVKSRRSVYMSALLCQTNERLFLFFGLFRFRPLLLSADRLSQNPKDCFD